MSTLEPLSNPGTGIVPPRLNGRYVVVQVLGKGAQARVYLAWDIRLKQWRAIKVLAAVHLKEPHIRTRFEGEAQMMAKLSHLNLLRVIDVDHDQEIPFMVMELARGGSVVDWMKRNGPLPPRMAVDVLIQVCAGLEHSHGHGVVHRDVKPHNILVQDPDRVVVTDFGIARADDAAQLTADGAAMGTFAFMAPEQRSDAHNVDHRADVYAVGTSLFTMLTLRTSAELFLAEVKDKILKGVPDLLQPIVVKACKYERDERYSTIGELRDALLEVRDRLPPYPPGPALYEELIGVPTEIPALVPADSGVDDLVNMMRPLEEQRTTLANEPKSSGRTDPTEKTDSLITAIPYQMPDLRKMREQQASAPPPSYVVPDYIDQSTLPPSRSDNKEVLEIGIEEKPKKKDQPKFQPPPRKPAEPKSAAPKAEDTTDSDSRSKTPTKAKANKTPAPAPRSAPVSGILRLLTLAFVGILIGTVLSVGLVLGVSYKTKSVASAAKRDASAALVSQVLQVQGIVENLVAEGADEKVLQPVWFELKDAKQNARAEAALEFARVSVAEADRVGAHGKAGSQVHQIRVKLDEYEAADANWNAARASTLGRLTGSAGAW